MQREGAQEVESALAVKATVEALRMTSFVSCLQLEGAQEVENALAVKAKAEALRGLRLDSYAIKGSEQEWQSALGDSKEGQKMGVSIKRCVYRCGKLWMILVCHNLSSRNK